MRILHLPTNPADQAGYIVRELASMGHEAELWQYGPPPFGFDADRIIDIEETDPRVLWRAFTEATERFDVFHFWYAGSMFQYPWSGVPLYWDLPILRALGKKVFFSFAGSEVRTRTVHAQFNPWSDLLFENFKPDEERIEKTLAIIRTYANRMFVLSAELQLYVPDAELMPRAFSLADWDDVPPADREVPMVLHAPSRRALKGTDRIVAGLEKLRNEGVPFEFQLVEGVTHDEMKKSIQNADVLIDNIVTGDHGISSLEAMACNRVAVAFLSEDVVRAMPGTPVFNVTPDSFTDRMRTLLTDRELRHSLASRGREYVRSNFAAAEVARAHLAHYQAEYPPLGIRTFPDWIGHADPRRYEQLEARASKLDVERAGLRAKVSSLEERTAALKGQLQRVEERWSFKYVLPPRARRALRRFRGGRG